ncbi:MAG: chorismate synthase [Eubacteriales bacterium]|jgi:chorismate synthase
MSSQFGEIVKVTVFGQSHGCAIGVVIDGLPAGEAIDYDELIAFMARRAPGRNKLTTSRREADVPELISGVTERDGAIVTCGSPLCAIIYNKDARPADYSRDGGFYRTPRPSHADYTARIKWGEAADMSGSGHFSGRLTAPLTAAGAIAAQILARRGIYTGAQLLSVGKAHGSRFPLYPTKEDFAATASREIPTYDEGAVDSMRAEIEAAAAGCDSVGGIIECAVIGMPAGVGEPMFSGVENMLSRALFGIPALTGVQFGSGFDGATSRGSKNNDPFIIRCGTVATETNNSGGIQGGITNGMPIVFRASIKPTPSVSQPQRTVDMDTMTETEIKITGRHDPCAALRAVPVVVAVASLVMLDLLTIAKKI